MLALSQKKKYIIPKAKGSRGLQLLREENWQQRSSTLASPAPKSSTFNSPNWCSNPTSSCIRKWWRGSPTQQERRNGQNDMYSATNHQSANPKPNNNCNQCSQNQHPNSPRPTSSGLPTSPKRTPSPARSTPTGTSTTNSSKISSPSQSKTASKSMIYRDYILDLNLKVQTLQKKHIFLPYSLFVSYGCYAALKRSSSSQKMPSSQQKT